MARRKWTKERVIEAIRAWHKSGRRLSKVWREDPPLYAAASVYLSGWCKALEAAGFPCTKRRWNSESITKALRERQQRQAAMTQVWKEDRNLYNAAKWHFGTWRNALRAAGLTPKARLTRGDVIAALRLRHRQGLSMTTVWKENVALYGNAKRLCGSWRNAIRAAGLEPEPPRKWSKQDVLEAIRERRWQGLPLVGVWQKARPLSTAAKRHFGTWYDAIAAAGMGRPCRSWNKGKVIAGLQACNRAGVRMSGVWKTDRRLFGAAQRYFGSWPNALEAAGVPHRRQRQWSREAVLQEFRDWHQGCIPAPSVKYAARQLFGSTKKAWEAIGVDPPYRKWTEQRVIEAIQDGYVRGLSTELRGFRDQSIAYAAKKYFGTWADALAAAGLPRQLGKPKRRTWDAQKVIEAIRAWCESGRHVSKVYKEDRSLYAAARTYLGTWRAAVKAAGLGPLRKQWTKRRVIEEIQAWHCQGVAASSISGQDARLTIAAIRLFGCWHDALVAAGLDVQPSRRRRRRTVKATRDSRQRRNGSLPSRVRKIGSSATEGGTAACHAKT